MTPLTRVHLLHAPNSADDWLRFGRPEVEQALGRRQCVAMFSPGALFAYVRWRGGDHGTTSWRLAVLRAVDPNTRATGIEGVWPGAEVLLSTSGEGPVQRAFTAIDQVEAAGFEPADVSPDYWRVAHNRIAAHGQPRPYGTAEHAAWLRRRSTLA